MVVRGHAKMAFFSFMPHGSTAQLITFYAISNLSFPALLQDVIIEFCFIMLLVIACCLVIHFFGTWQVLMVMMVLEFQGLEHLESGSYFFEFSMFLQSSSQDLMFLCRYKVTDDDDQLMLEFFEPKAKNDTQQT